MARAANSHGVRGLSAKRQIGLSWPLITPSSFQYACPGAKLRAVRNHQKKSAEAVPRHALAVRQAML